MEDKKELIIDECLAEHKEDFIKLGWLKDGIYNSERIYPLMNFARECLLKYERFLINSVPNSHPEQNQVIAESHSSEGKRNENRLD